MPFDGRDFLDAEILQRARDGIAARERWAQGHATIGDSHCAVGWLMEATGSRLWEDPEVERLVATYLLPELPRRWRRQIAFGPARAVVGCYQDRPWRRHATVVRLFDRALARREANENG